MFETPFTKDGKARGTPEDQWKRRTILTSNLESFFQQLPYILKKIDYSSGCFTLMHMKYYNCISLFDSQIHDVYVK
jgi:hypothetical protein